MKPLAISENSQKVINDILQRAAKALSHEAHISQFTHLRVSIDIRRDTPAPEVGIKVEASRTETNTFYLTVNKEDA